MTLTLISQNFDNELFFTEKTFKIIAVKKNYFIIQDYFFKKYYLSSKGFLSNNDFCLNRYLTISGKLISFQNDTKIYSFNFKNYLENQEVFYELKPEKITLLTQGFLYRINLFYQRIFPNELQQIFLLANFNNDFKLVNSLDTLSLKHLLNFSGLTIFLWDYLLSKLNKSLKVSFKFTCWVKETLCFLLLTYSFTLRLPFIFTKTLVFLIIKNFFWIKHIKLNKYNLWTASFSLLLTFHLEIIFSTVIFYYLMALFFFRKLDLDSFWKTIVINFLITTLTFGLLGALFNYRFYYFSSAFATLFAPEISGLNLFVILTCWVPKIEIVYSFLTNQIINQIVIFEKINYYYSFGKINSLYYLLLFSFLWCLFTFWSKSWSTSFCFLISFLLFVGLFFYKYLFMPYGFHVLDVGNGLTTIYLDKKTSLIFDVGIGAGHDKRQLSDFCRFYGIDRIDYVFISHAHADHYNGLENLIKSGVKVNGVIHKENALDFYLIKNVELHVFNRNQSNQNENNNSLVIILKTAKENFLLPGDLEHKGENVLLKDERFKKMIQVTKIDYLVVGHHGSKTSTSIEWLKSIEPKFAIISGEFKGFNRFPNVETINNLKSLEIPYFVTSKIGDIWIK